MSRKQLNTENSRRLKVLISGGGIGGLTAALCCLHFGHDVTVFEQAAELGEVGAGIQLPPNAMKVFDALGLSEAIAQNAFRPESIEARMGESGRPIFTIPLAQQAVERWGSPYLHIHRADYIEALREALLERAPDALRLGAAIKNYQNDEEAVTIALKSGETISGDTFFGADGIKSAIRAQMIGDDKAVFTGNVAWRGVVPIDALGETAPNPTACVWMGKGRHAVTYRLRGGKLANFVGVVEREDWTGEGWRAVGPISEALKDFEGWHPTVTSLLKAIPQDSLFRWALFDRPPLSRWVDGRVALLGDAAHPMLPFLAQGAAMAVEDSWVLAQQISQSGRPVADSLKVYQSLRLNRTSRVQAASRANMKTFHKPTKLGQVATYGPMWLAGKILPSIVHRRMDWLYGYDATQGL